MRYINLSAIAFSIALMGCSSMGGPGPGGVVLPAGVTEQSATKSEGDLRWWSGLNDKELVSFIDRGVEKNLSIQSLQQRLEAAKIAAGTSAASISPSGSVSMGIANTILANGSLATQAAAASWTLPLYEKAENTKLLSNAQYLQVLWNTEASKQVLAGNILVAYSNYQLATMRYKVAKDNWYLNDLKLLIMAKELKEGKISEAEYQAQQQLVNDYEVLKQKALSLSVTNTYVLAAYMGVSSAESLKIPEFKWLDSLPSVNLESPSLMKNRPDVKLAEAKLLAAAASVGISEAELKPQLTFSFSTNKQGSSPSVSVLGAQLSIPLLNWYLLNQQHKMTSKYFDESVYAYNDAVLNAWSEIGKARASWAAAYSEEQLRRDSLAKESDELQRKETAYKTGRISYKELLDAQLVHGNKKLAYFESYLTKIAAWAKAKQETLK